jgi:hypothetical protein
MNEDTESLTLYLFVYYTYLLPIFKTGRGCESSHPLHQEHMTDVITLILHSRVPSAPACPEAYLPLSAPSDIY